jgi:hypothetical protein
MVKAGSDALALPSLTLIVMLANVLPASVAAGVPCSLPVLAVNVAHDGLFAMLKVSDGFGSGSLAVGVKVYCEPALADVAGEPEIVGALFVTVTANAASVAAPPLPSLTLITMLLVVPASAAAGVPDSRPVLGVNVAHDGLLGPIE